jgi:hypothetical protein
MANETKTKERETEIVEFKKENDNSNDISIKERIRADDVDKKDGFIITAQLVGTEPATAANYEVFFIAPKPCMVLEVREVHRVLGTNAGAVTLNIEKLTGTQALDAGVTLCKTAFNLKSTINTVVTKKYADLQNLVLAAGDRLALKDAGTLTAVAGLTITLYLIYLDNGDYRK